MKLVFIFPPYSHKVFSENLSTVDEEFCLAPPLILAYIAAILERHGHKVMLLDIRALELTKEEVLQKIKDFAPDLLAFRSETYHFHDALEWVGFFKDALAIPVVTGGVNLSLYPIETMSHSEIDYGIIGEAIESLPRLVSSLEEDGCGIDRIPGVAYKKDGKIFLNPPSEHSVDLDTYPFPARHLLPNERYYSFISQLKNFTIMITSVGCPYGCSFCAIHPLISYRARSIKNVVDEIELCYREFAVREIDFFDAVLFIDKARMFELFDEIRRRGIRIDWSCRSRVDVVDKDLLREAARAGCRQIYYGIESVNIEILDSIRKRISTQQVRDAVRWSKNYGIRAMGFFMVGSPGETKESVYRTIEFAKSLNLDFIQVCRTIAKPGTELNNLMIKNTGRDYWREHVAGKKIEKRLPAPWTSLNEKEIESLTKKFYIKFYMRPKVILNRVLQLKSLVEMLRFVRVGIKMFLQKSELSSRIATDLTDASALLRQSGKYIAQVDMFKVAVVMPTYNEKDNLEKMVLAIRYILKHAHIVIVDDNSPDGTGAIADRLSAMDNAVHILHRTGRRGLGLSYIEGLKYVLGRLDSDYIFEIDSDLSHNPGYMPAFLHYAVKNDLVTGSRFLKKITIRNRRRWRNFISIATKLLANRLMGLNLTDVSTGFKCFKRQCLEKIDLDKISSRGYAFQIEMSYNVIKNGGTIKELPILFEERVMGHSKMSLGILIEGVLLVFKLGLSRLSRRFLKYVYSQKGACGRSRWFYRSPSG